MTARRHRTWGAGLLAAALVLTACGGDDAEDVEAPEGDVDAPEEDADATQEGDADATDEDADATGDGASDEPADGELATVRVASLAGGLLSVTGSLDIAQEQGFFADEGIEMEFVETSGGGAIVQAVIAGEADIGTQTGATAVIGAFQQGADLRVIGAAYTGYDGVWVGPARDDIDGKEDMGGELIGYSSPGSGSNIAAEVLASNMEAEGLEPVVPEAIGGTTDQLTAAETGQIMAAYANPPVGLDEVQTGEYQVYFNAFEELPQYEDVATRYTFTTQSFLDENEDLAVAFLNATQTAWDFLFENPEEGCEIWLRRSDLPYSSESCVDAVENYYSRDGFAATPIGGIEQSVSDGIEYDLLERELEEDERDTLFVDLLGDS